MELLQPFAPGDIIPKGGSYWVRHLAHRRPYLAVIEKAQRLPRCSHCNVVFEYASDLITGGINIEADGDLYPHKDVWGR